MYGSSYCRKKSRGAQGDVQTTFALQLDTLPYEPEPDVTTMDAENLGEQPHVEGEPHSEATHRFRVHACNIITHIYICIYMYT